MTAILLSDLYPLLLLPSSVTLVIAVPFILIVFFFVFRLFRQRAAAQRIKGGMATCVYCGRPLV